YPIIELRASKSALFDQPTLKTEQTKIIVEDPSVFPTKEYITSKIEAILRASIRKGFLQINNLDPIETAVQFYKNAEEYFELRSTDKGVNVASDNTSDNAQGLDNSGNNVEEAFRNSDPIINNEK